MDWTMPDRPRRLVTYGKLAHNRTERKQRTQLPQTPEEKSSNGLGAKQFKIGSPTRSENDCLPSVRESFEDTVIGERNHDTESPSQSNRPRNRSPKRRKLSPRDDGQISPVHGPQSRTRRGAATQTTYSRNDPLRRSVSDIPGAKERSNTRISLSPDRFSERTVSPSNLHTAFRQTNTTSTAAGTPSRRRLVDSLRAIDDQADSSHSDADSPQQSSDVAISRQATPIFSEYRGSQSNDIQLEPRLRRKNYEVVENVASPQSASPKVTYSRQRSFLSSIDLHGDPSSDAKNDFSADVYSLPLQSTSVDDTEAEKTENSRTVRSIHELRRAGVNARFQGLVDSIFEDIEDRSSSASVRRSGFIQICEKLSDERFAQRFVEIGAFERLAKFMPASGDSITILLSIYACALVLRLSHLPPAVYTCAWPKLIASAPTLLPLDDSTPKLITQRRYALSRINQASIRDISLEFGRLSNLDEQEALKLSPRRLILRSLHSTVRKVRENDLAETIPVEVVSKLVDILLQLAQQVTDHDKASDNFVIFESVISILETYTTSSDITGKAQQDILMPLADSCHLLFSLSEQNDAQDIQLLTLYLKLILNITNANPSLCEKFATTDLIHGLTMIVLSNYSTASDEFVDDKKDSLDIIILALGALINLTEVSEAARQNIITQKKGSQSLLERLISIFTRGLETVSEADSVVQTHSNVAFGYLSILLCTLCIEREAYSIVKGTMNGVGLEKLLATVEEFLHYHRKVDEELHQSQSLKEFTSRLQRIMNQVRAIDGA